MTTDDILRMAREAHAELLASGRGMHVWHDDSYAGDVQAFCERFYAMATAAERESCAKVAKAISDKYAFGHYGNEVDTADEIAAAIRARGTK